jgi:O-antigen ligase
VSTAILDRHQPLLVSLGVVLASVAAGLVVARSQSGVSLALIAMLALAGLVVLLSLPPAGLFLGWLAVAPIFADSAQASALGRAGILAIYTAPAILLAVLAATRARPGATLSYVEFMPAAFVAYVLASIFFTSDALQTNPAGTMRFFFVMVALGPLLYYFLTIGPGSAVSREKLLAVLMIGGVVQGCLALVEAATHWNPWGYTSWQSAVGGARAVATMANPGILGMFLGVAIVIALAVLLWDGPRSLRRLSWLTLVFAVPGLLVTLTRGPILATALAALVVLVLSRKRLASIAAIASLAVAVALLWPSIRATAVYQERATESTTVLVRSGLQAWSLQLAEQKPLFGWGYGSFDRVKNTADLASIEGIPVRFLLGYTSHNTYLTMLVEIGAIGLLLYALPFLWFTGRGIVRARARPPDRWLVVAVVLSLLVIALSASTLDFRFFSFAQVLPWLLLAILRDTATAPIATVATR